MSYRSIKRVLGETSLERKCRFLFGACLLLLITASFWSCSYLTEKLVEEAMRFVMTAGVSSRKPQAETPTKEEQAEEEKPSEDA